MILTASAGAAGLALTLAQQRSVERCCRGRAAAWGCFHVRVAMTSISRRRVFLYFLVFSMTGAGDPTVLLLILDVAEKNVGGRGCEKQKGGKAEPVTPRDHDA